MVSLGYLGEALGEWDTDPYVPKVGGKPLALPGTKSNPKFPVECNNCSKPLVLVLQTWAPFYHVQGADARVLYLFGCDSAACSKSASNWTLMRVSRPATQAEIDFDSVLEDGNEGGSENDSKKATGTASTSGLFGSGSGAPSIDDLSALLSGLNTASSESSQSQQDQEKSSKTSKTASGGSKGSSTVWKSPVVKSSWKGKVWPSYCLSIAPEPESAVKKGKRKGASSSGVKTSVEVGGGSVGGEEWGGDEYESGMEKAFRGFQKRLAAAPEQVLRYEIDGIPLVPRAVKVEGDPEATGGGVCSRCGEKRVMEVQIMPPLLYYMAPDAGLSEESLAALTAVTVTDSSTPVVQEEAASTKIPAARGKGKGKEPADQSVGVEDDGGHDDDDDDEGDDALAQDGDGESAATSSAPSSTGPRPVLEAGGMDFGVVTLYCCPNSCGKAGEYVTEAVEVINTYTE